MSSPFIPRLGRKLLAAAFVSTLFVTACGGDDPMPAAISACGNKALASLKPSCPPSAASAASK